MDATCAIQASIHVFSLVRKYVSRILGTYHCASGLSFCLKIQMEGVKSAIWLFVGYKWYTGGIQVVHTKM